MIITGDMRSCEERGTRWFAIHVDGHAQAVELFVLESAAEAGLEPAARRRVPSVAFGEWRRPFRCLPNVQADRRNKGAI